MFSLLGGIVAAAATTSLGAFAEGVAISVIAFGMVSSTAKANISLKK